MDGVTQAFESIETAFRKEHPQRAGDFYDNEGFLCCGTCKGRKEMMIPFMGTQRKVPRMCDCEQGSYYRAKEAEEKRRSEEEVARYRKLGFPDTELANCTFDKDDGSNSKIIQVAKNYVEHFDLMWSKNKGLLLYGPVGTGKTFIAACIANALIDRGRHCLVTNFARLVNTINGLYKEDRQEYFDSLSEFHLLVIDDLAAERDTEYMQEIVFNIIDARYRSGRPLIVTTNLTATELKDPGDMRRKRIYSRLFEMCLPVEVTGNDRRKEKLKQDYSELHSLLGL